MKIERKIYAVVLVSILLGTGFLSVWATRTITSNKDTVTGTYFYEGNYDFITGSHFNLTNKIYNSKGHIWNATWANIQLAINDVNGTGTVYLPQGTITGSTTLNIDDEVNLIGAGKDSTILDYSGTGKVIYVDGVNNYVMGMTISDLYIKANNCTGINLTATTPNVITMCTFERIIIENPLYGIRIYVPGGSDTVYRNQFNSIYIWEINQPGTGILSNGGAYNTFYDICIVNEIKTTEKIYAMQVSGNNCDYNSISTDAPIYSYGQNTHWSDVAIEGLYPAYDPLLDGSDTVGFWLAGNGCVIDTLTFAETNCTIGLKVTNYNQTIINLRAYTASTKNPTYLFFPVQGGQSTGTAINVFGSSGDTVTWSHLNDDTGWNFINVKGRNYFDGYIKITPKTAWTNTPLEGEIRYNDTTNKLFCYDGTKWQALW